MIAKFLNYHLFILSIGLKNKANLSQENPLYISTDKKSSYIHRVGKYFRIIIWIMVKLCIEHLPGSWLLNEELLKY